MSLPITKGINLLPEVRLDGLSQGKSAGNVETADVCGPGGPNALPPVMEGEFLGQAPREVIGLADIAGVPVPVEGHLAEDVDAGTLEVAHPNLVKLEGISLSGLADPNHSRRIGGRERIRVLLQ
jgi:hypothetical protein